VVVVADDSGAGELLARVLELDGHTVHRATSAERAANLVSRQAVQLAVIALGSGDDDANLALLRELRRDLRTTFEAVASDVAVVVVDSAIRAEPAWAAGADGFVARPVAATALRRVVNKALARSDEERVCHRADQLAAIRSQR